MFKRIIIILTIILSITGILTTPPTSAASTVSEEWKKLIARRVPSLALRNIHGFTQEQWSQERTDFIAAVEKLASRFGMDPNLVLSFMLFETGGSLDSSLQGSCIGLIQFCPGTGLKSTAKFDSRCNANNIRKLLPSEQTEICVAIYFQNNLKVKNRDLGTLYAVVNWPAGQYPAANVPWYCENTAVVVNGVTYSSTVFGKQSQDLKNNADIVNGKRCVTRNSASRALADWVKRNSSILVDTNQSYVDNNSSLPEANLSREEFEKAILDLGNDESWKLQTLTQEEYEAAQKELDTRQADTLQNTLRNDIALPLNILGSCSLFDASGAPVLVNNGAVLIGCIKSILTYVFIIAIIYTIILITSSNISTIITAGGKGSSPIANTRKRLEKAVIGLFLIGSPFLLLDLFSQSLGAFEFVPLDKIPKIEIASIKIDSGLPDNLGSGSEERNLLYNLFAAYGSTSDSSSVQNIPFEEAVPVRDPNGNTTSKIPQLCVNQPSACKIIRNSEGNTVPYVSQAFTSQGKRDPYGNQACGATSSVMAGAFLKPELYDNSTGRNNISNLGLRDQVFYASSYLKSQKPDLHCLYAGVSAGDRSKKIDGAFAITGIKAEGWPSSSGDICGSNFGAGIDAYFKYYNIKTELVAMNWEKSEAVYTRLRQAIDQNKPIIMRFEKPGVTAGHFLVIKGYVKSSLSEFIVNDPWGNLNTTNFPGTPDGGNGAIYNLNTLKNTPTNTYRIISN